MSTNINAKPYMWKQPASKITGTVRDREETVEPGPQAPVQDGERKASIITKWLPKSEHDFVNNADGSRDGKTVCISCKKTVDELCQLRCDGNKSGSTQESIQVLVSENKSLLEANMAMQDALDYQKQENARIMAMYASTKK